MTIGLGAEAAMSHLALFYDTATITGLRAGSPQSINVVPATALAYVDGRTLPGQTQEGFLSALRERIGKEIDVEVYAGQWAPGIEAPCTAPIMNMMAQVIGEQCRGAQVVPWMCAGSTDAKALAPLGLPVYGFVPTQPLPEGVHDAGAHSDNERLWIENLSFSLNVLYDLVARFCTETA